MKKGAILVAVLVMASFALGTMALFSSPAEARPPRLLCGPTYMWSCSAVGGPDYLFIGTVCEKNRYERKTGRTCVPI